VLPQVALGSGARVVIVNREPTPYDVVADAVIAGSIKDSLPAIVDLV
jgi:NAD-dependent protein deacetylase/lipoamidase